MLPGLCMRYGKGCRRGQAGALPMTQIKMGDIVR